MRLCQIMLGKGFGGAERYFVDLSQALAAQGHEVLAICHRGGQAEALLPSQPGLQVRTVRVLGWWDPLAVGKIKQLIETFNPQLSHAHLARAACLAGRAQRDLAVPLLAKTHNYVDIKYYRQVARFLPTTQDQKRYLIEQGIAPAKITVIPNFSSIPAVTSITAKQKINKLVSCGRFVKKKGYELLLRAFAEIALDKPALELALVGDGEERSALEDMVSSASLDGRVSFVGWQEDVRPYLDAADAFVLPSLEEPFGIVVLEAMARGLPIVSTRTQGPLEVLSETNACLVAVDDKEALKKALLELIASPEAAQHKAERALQAFNQRYSQAAVLPQLLSAYQALPDQ